MQYEYQKEYVSKTIKYCPFCGGEATVVSMLNKEKESRVFFVECVLCGAKGQAVPCYVPYDKHVCETTKSKAIDFWNNRVK